MLIWWYDIMWLLVLVYWLPLQRAVGTRDRQAKRLLWSVVWRDVSGTKRTIRWLAAAAAADVAGKYGNNTRGDFDSLFQFTLALDLTRYSSTLRYQWPQYSVLLIQQVPGISLLRFIFSPSPYIIFAFVSSQNTPGIIVILLILRGTIGNRTKYC